MISAWWLVVAFVAGFAVGKVFEWVRWSLWLDERRFDSHGGNQ